MAESKSWPELDVKQKSYAKQLWSMDGPTWRIPLEVCWPEQPDVGLVKIHPLISHISLISKVANEVLSSVCFRPSEEGYWITSRDLHKIARKMPHDNAEKVLQWVNPEESPAHPILTRACGRDPGAELREEFFARMLPRVSIPWIQSTADLEMIWRMFCASMLEWMINVQKPVDMIFCKLAPSPYRPGWERDWNWAHNSSVNPPGVLSSGYQKFSPSSKVAHWYLQVIHKKNWWRSTLKAERVRRKEYGKRRYFRYTLRTLEKVKPYTQEIFKDWKHQARLPKHHPDKDDVVGWVRHSHPGRVRRVFRSRKNGMPRTVWMRKKKKQFKFGPVAKKAKQLSLLPGIQHFDKDVRHYREARVGARKALLGPNGVLLRNVVGDETPL